MTTRDLFRPHSITLHNGVVHPLAVYKLSQGWIVPGGIVHPIHVADTRRLVVIDPEGDEVHELLKLIMKDFMFVYDRPGRPSCRPVDRFRKHLREFNAPPPPKEPTDPASRVWANGCEWAKVGPWWVSPAVNEVPREWGYLVESVGFQVLPESVTS